MNDYTRLEYIESTGTQYINTGVIGKTGIRATGDILFNDVVSDTIPLGCFSPNRCYLISVNNGGIRYGYGEWVNSSKSPVIGRKYSFDVDFSPNGQYMKLDDETWASSALTNTITNSTTIYAFAYNDGGTPDGFSKCRIYGLKLYENGILIRNFVPCRTSSNAVGLYDEVTDVFYGNSGSGVFIAGEPIATAPKSCGKVNISSLVKELTSWRANVESVLKEVTGGFNNINGVLYPWKMSLLPEVGISLENCTWEEISLISKAGLASEYWTIGEQKLIYIDGASYAVDIIGFDHDTPTDVSAYGRNKVGITLQMNRLTPDIYPMTNSSSNSAGWKDSKMRNDTMPTFLSKLDSELQNVIVPVDKLSGYGESGRNGIVTTSDSLFLLAEIEIFGSRSYSVDGEGYQYQYYSNGGSKKKPYPTIPSSYRAWYTRSVTTGNKTGFVYVTNNGESAQNQYSSGSLNISFAFCV